MVNQAIKGLVEEEFGAEVWAKIHEKAGAPASFVVMEPYDDAVTYNLVDAASEVLGVAPDAVLRKFGEYWILKIATVHYAALMSSTGQTFIDFLKNLDHMHQRIRVAFPNYEPPSFRVKPLSEGLVQVDYYSKRSGLLPFLEGLFSGLGNHFRLQITLNHVPDSQHNLPGKRFLVGYKSAE